MTGIKRILYPIDFSECSYQALPYVLSLAEKYEAEIQLLHVVDDLRRFSGMNLRRSSVSEFINEAMAAAEKMLDRVCEEQR